MKKEEEDKSNQQKQVTFLQEVFKNSSFSERWTLDLETKKVNTLNSQYCDLRTISISIRPRNEDEKNELNQLSKKISEIAELQPETYKPFKDLQIYQGIKVGDLFPHYTEVKSIMNDNEEEIKHQQGEVILLDVWATWCGPCQSSMQKNQDLLTKNTKRWADRIRVIALSVDDRREDALQRINDQRWEKMTHLKLNGWDDKHPIMNDFSIQSIPFVALVDTFGIINYIGHPFSINLEERINQLIIKEETQNNLPISLTNKTQRNEDVPQGDQIPNIEMTAEQYKQAKQFIKKGLQKCIDSQNSENINFSYSLSLLKQVVMTHNSVKKIYNYPRVISSVDKRQLQNYINFKQTVAKQLPNIQIVSEKEIINDIQLEIKKDLIVLANIYKKYHLNSFENKHSATLSLRIKDGKFILLRNDSLSQNQKLFMKKGEEIETIQEAVKEQRTFILNKFKLGQYASYLRKMFVNDIRMTSQQEYKPKSHEDIYRKYKDILESKGMQELSFDSTLGYNPEFKINLKRRRVFDFTGEMKYKYYCQPVCKYTIRKLDAEKFQTEVLDKLFEKIDQNDLIFKTEILNQTSIQIGKNCKQCNTELVVPYYLNPFQKEHYCLTCGDKKDDNEDTMKYFSIPHNLVLITTMEKEYLNDIDEYKLGKDTQPSHEQTIEFKFEYQCSGCFKDELNSRYICLNCNSGPCREVGFVEFCKECIQKIVFEKDEEFQKSVQLRNMDHNNNHIYLKILTSVGNYNDF